MSDIVDLANDHAAMLLDAALRDQRARTHARDGLFSAVVCEGQGCGAEIEEDRRRLVPGVRLCVDCQTRFERLGR